MEIILTIYGIGCISTMFMGFCDGWSHDKNDPPMRPWAAVMMVIFIPGYVIGWIIGRILNAIL